MESLQHGHHWGVPPAPIPCLRLPTLPWLWRVSPTDLLTYYYWPTTFSGRLLSNKCEPQKWAPHTSGHPTNKVAGGQRLLPFASRQDQICGSTQDVFSLCSVWHPALATFQPKPLSCEVSSLAESYWPCSLSPDSTPVVINNKHMDRNPCFRLDLQKPDLCPPLNVSPDFLITLIFYFFCLKANAWSPEPECSFWSL